MDRAETGPVCRLRDWEARLVPQKVMEKIKEYDLQNTFDPQNPVNTDNSLANDFFKAGFELAVDLGMICTNTERIIKISEDELKETLKKLPREITLGEGNDHVVMRKRQLEDKIQPLWCSSFGIAVSEELWIPIMQGIVQHREVDIAQGPCIETVYGRPIKAGTPYETLAARVQAQMHHEALWRAGRPGLCTTSVIISPTVYGQLGAFGVPGGFKPTDIAIALSPAEIKVSYVELHKIAHAINCGCRVILGDSSVMIGGSVGPPEGAAVGSIARSLLKCAVHGAFGTLVSFPGGGIYDIKYMGNTGRAARWASSVQTQALSKNTEALTMGHLSQVSGPCTEMLLYETIVGMSIETVSGACWSIGPRSGGGKYTNYITPLECKFAGEVLKKSAGMKRSDVNEIAKKLIPKYEDKLKYPPKGKSFLECYDRKTLKPSKEWSDMYLKIKQEAIDLGIPLDDH